VSGARELLIEPTSGISGDMFVAAAASLAACEAEVRALPARLGLVDVHCGFQDVTRSGFRARKFDVNAGTGSADDHTHAHRPLSEILQRIKASGLEPTVAERAARMFRRLGDVESAIHGIPVENVHFHEVGAIDSIIDIVASALCIERLNVSSVFSTPICTGSGYVETTHGLLPVPAPATERLLQGMPTQPGALEGEWTTPTGALVMSELKVQFHLPVLVTTASVYGTGMRDPAHRPNLLRLRLCTTAQAVADGLERDEVAVIRCNIDDTTGEYLGADFMDELLAAGARDIVIAPVVMKKGRPGHVIEILTDTELAETLGVMLIENTRSIGVRISSASRLMLPRETCTIETHYGTLAAKVVRLPNGRCRTKPEFEACRKLARENGVSIQDIYTAALAAAASDEV